MFRFIPPVGHPIKLSDIFTSFVKSSLGRKSNFENILNKHLSVNHNFVVSSGTAALYLILKIVKEYTNKSEVIIPAYTCPSLVASAVRAGMKVNICDTNRDNFSFDLESLKNLTTKNTAAIIAVHLFGIPSDVNEINRIAKKHRTLVIEDSTQAFGVKNGNSMLGLSTDIGFYSFGRGKPVSMLAGGTIVTKSKVIAKLLQKEVNDLAELTFSDLFLSIINLVIYRFFVLPRLFWIPNSLPFLKIGETEYRDNFRFTRLSEFHRILVTKLLEDFKKNNDDRIKKSAYFAKNLLNIKSNKLSFIPSTPLKIPYLRFPILFSNNELRDRILVQLRKEGIGATDMYKKPLNKIEGMPLNIINNSTFEKAEDISKRLLTVPVSSYTKYSDLDNILNIIKQYLE